MATVLVVDDEVASRLLLRQILLACGVDVIEAPDAESALERYRSDHVDLVISDQEMPLLSGIQLRAALGDRLRCPFVLLTGYADEDELGAEEDLTGVDAFVTKPIGSRAVRALLERFAIAADG